VSPIADEALRLEDGRSLAWAEWGDPQGAPVFFLHCSPGSRLFCPDEDAAAASGVRLITVDRPGYGGSDASSDPTLVGFARDLARLTDHLWLGRISVVGWSGGGQYAAACAAFLGARVHTLVLAGTPAPDEQVAWLPDVARHVARLAKADPAAALAAAGRAGSVLVDELEQAGDSWNDLSETAIPNRSAVERALVSMWREAFRNGADGLAADLVAGSMTWDFDPAGVSARPHLFYGADDDAVGLAHGHWWAAALPNAALSVVRHGGHLVPFVAWREILHVSVP
jgi:pimeloyl-ACP methyl ester carboxylesterase